MCTAMFTGVQSVCETGFNLGHSATTFLNASDNLTVISFDLCTDGKSETETRLGSGADDVLYDTLFSSGPLKDPLTRQHRRT